VLTFVPRREIVGGNVTRAKRKSGPNALWCYIASDGRRGCSELIIGEAGGRGGSIKIINE